MMAAGNSTQGPPSTSVVYVKTGIPGLDQVLHGGLLPASFYLVEGEAGTGKTTVGLLFALEGKRQGEKSLYITLSEIARKLRVDAASHGWSLEGIEILELISAPPLDDQDERYMLFHPSDVELTETVRKIGEAVRRYQPSRVVLDSVAELRVLAQHPSWYRRDMMALRRFLEESEATILLLDSPSEDLSTRTLMDGVIDLDQSAPGYGRARRRLQVTKARAKTYSSGYHDFVISASGLEVYPRLSPGDHPPQAGREASKVDVHSGVPSLDKLFGGSLPPGSSTLLIGPPGTGKSSLATRYACQAVEQGARAAIFAFDESRESLLLRSASLGLPIEKYERDGNIMIEQIDPAEITPGQFAALVHDGVENRNVSVVCIDSLNGYMQSMPNEQYLMVQLHEMLTYLGQQHVSTFLVMAQSGFPGAYETPVSASYLIDNILVLRFFEAAGEVRKAISVMKKRTGAHERTIREFSLGPDGIHVGEPLTQFQGVLTGTPRFTGVVGSLIEKKHGESGKRPK